MKRAAFLALWLGAVAAPGAPPPLAEISLGGETFFLEVAATAADRRTGLMHRERLAPGAGMIFVYSQTARHTYWMKDVTIDLDLLCVDRAGEVVRVHHMPAEPPRTPAESEDRYGARLARYACPPIQYAIELPLGTAQRLGLMAGTRIDLPVARLRSQAQDGPPAAGGGQIDVDAPPRLSKDSSGNADTGGSWR